MSKKKNDDDNMFKMMADMFKKIATGDQDEVSSLLGSLQEKTLEIINTRFYHYQRPDYLADIDEKLPEWLMPVWDADDNVDIVKLCKSVDKAGSKLSAEQRKKDIHTYMMNLFGRFYDEEQVCHWRLFGIFWLMEKYGFSDINLVLETLRQDAWFIERYTSGLEDIMSNVLYEQAGDDIQPLKDFLYAQGYVPASKKIVFSALVTRIGQHPEERLSLVSWLTEFLKHCYDICMKGAYPGNLCHYIDTLAQANVHEAMPIIKKIISDIDNVMFETGETEYDIEYEMKTIHPKVTPETLTMDYTIRNWGKNDDIFDDDLFSSLSELFKSASSKEEEPESELYAANEDKRKYSISAMWVEYDDYEVGGVGVDITVPSNIYLSQLAKLIMLSFGIDDLPEYFFEDISGDYYTEANSKTAKSFTKEDVDFEDIDDVLLSDVLTKNNNMIRLYTDPYTDIERTYNIGLNKIGNYGKDTKQLVRLENIYGPSPTKEYKVARDLYDEVCAGKAKTPNIKKIRASIKKWYESVM